MTRLICLAAFLCVGILSHGQVLQNIKKAAEGKVKQAANNATSQQNIEKQASKGWNKMREGLNKSRAQFDSADFDYAVLVSDNSGLFDVKEKGELKAKFATSANTMTSLYKDGELKDAENARLKLDMGEIAYASRRYSYAEKNFKASQGLYEKAGLTSDIGYIKAIANQGLLFATTGRFMQAEGLTSEALDMRRQKFGSDNLAVASSLNNYGVLHYNLGRYNEAETDLQSALSVLSKNNMQAAMQYAIILNNKAILFQAVGRYDESVELLKQAVGIAEKLTGSKSSNLKKFNSNLALLYQQMARYEEAEKMYLAMEKQFGKNDPDYGSMLNNLAALYLKMGKEDKVEEPLKKAIAIYKSNFGEENPAFAKASSDLGNFYRYKARYSEASPLLDKALMIREKTLGVSHPHFVQSKEDLAILYWKQQNWDKAYALYREVMDKSIDFVNRYFAPMSESEKTKYWDVLFPRFQRFDNFAYECSAYNKHVVGDLYDYQMATKGLLLNSTTKVKQAIFASNNAALIKEYITWLDQKEQLARLYAYSKEELTDQKINLDSIERSANAMERSLSSQSAEFSKGYSAQKASFKDVQKVLADQEALVSIIRVSVFGQSFTEEVKYLVLILTKNDEVPRLVVLENGQQLETRYAKFYRNAIQQKIVDEYSYDQYWAPLEVHLAGKKKIYLSTDGVYNQINLNTLRRGTGDFFINRFDLVVIGNARDLVTAKTARPATQKKTATLLGFPDYGGSSVSALPGTRVELEGVSKILKTGGFQVATFMQQNATETNIKAVKGPTILHIATHGYFLADVSRTQGSAFGIHLENANDNPLLRSGLLLAGAAKTASGAMPNLNSNDNGVLTAYEAMNLNLEETNLVIMSACETGLGDVRAGEGVYGLQRAFLVAGADAMIMSLWKVDDAATQALMTNFYTQWVKLRDKQKAFKQAQLQLMTKYKEPYYWGAFVMMGI
jgi:CHAT domain-containing protein